MLALSVTDGNHLTLVHLQRVFGDAVYLDVLWITLKWSFVVTVLCLLLGYPVAYLLGDVGSRAFSLIMICVLLPFSMSRLVRTYAWMILLGRTGVFNSFLVGLGIVSAPLPLMNNLFAVIVGMVQILLPFMILTLFSAMKNIDRSLVKAASTLGAPPHQAFLRIFVPLSLPGIAAGSVLVFILSVGFFIVPALLGGLRDVWISMLIESQVNALLDWHMGSALGVVLLAVVLVLYFAYERLLGVDRLAGTG
jgi:ABC-type spermidine/putrescine transport system permease subunit I